MSEENKDIKVNEEEKKALENQDTLANTLENRIPLPAKEKHYNSQNLLRILLVVALILLGLSIYAYNNPPIIINPPSDTPAPQTSLSPLPDELIDVNSATVLVDKNHPLPEDFVPSNLQKPYISSTGEAIEVSHLASDHLKEMVAAASDDGVNLIITSAYVSYANQADYYADRLAMVGEAEANITMPKAGFSEHQTGLAIDFNDTDQSGNATVEFANTEAGQWLHDHAHEYGFILRYPKNKESITGYTYMPWHYRYVGTDVSNAMYEKDPDYTFEEFYEIQQ